MKHPLGILPLSVSVFFEHLGFCLLQGALFKLVYSLQDHTEVNIYASYTIVYFAMSLMRILGGLLADTLLGSRLSAQIGLGLGVLACGLFAVPDMPGLSYLAAFLGVMSAGFYAPASLSLVGMLYRNQRRSHDAAVLILFVVMEIATFIVCVLPNLFKGLENSNWLYLVAILAYALAAVPLFINGAGLDSLRYTANKNIAAGPAPKQAILSTLILLFFIYPLYEIMSNISDNISINFDKILSQFTPAGVHQGTFYYGYILPVAATVMSILLIVLCSYTRFPALLRMAIGFILYLPVAFLCFLLKTQLASEDTLAPAILFLQMLPAAFIMPAAWAYVSRHVPLRYNATFIALFQAVSILIPVVINSIMYRAHDHDSLIPRDLLEPVMLAGGMFLIIGAIVLLFILNGLRANRSEDSNADDEDSGNASDYKMASNLN